jgi:AbrB family looped-hinge helix DNA binding protein
MLKRDAKLTSKGQITVPRDVRRLLGVEPGDRLRFESDGGEVKIRPVRARSRFAEYRGIGNPSLRSGRKAINEWLRDLRGK